MQELICVLDRSGSMQSCADEAVIAFNLFLEQQKAIGEARLTLIWFDQNVEVAYDGLLLSEAPPLSHWPNGGMTALYDAVGTAFEYVCERFSREKPEKVVLAILTDGQENSSRKFSPAQAKNLIKHHRERYAWDVIFLGCEFVQEVAASLNISTSDCYTWSSDNVRGAIETYSTAIGEKRLGSQS